jgi:hypothetical protein
MNGRLMCAFVELHSMPRVAQSQQRCDRMPTEEDDLQMRVQPLKEEAHKAARPVPVGLTCLHSRLDDGRR